MAKKKSSDVTKIAKNGTTNKSNKKQSTTKTEGNKSTTSYDSKAKERVNKLLNDVDLTLKENESDTLVLDDKNMKSLEWLQEQNQRLSEENEELKKDAEVAKENYKKLHSQYKELIDNGGEKKQEKDLVPDSMLKNGVTELFNEFQKNFLGQNPEKTRYTEIKLKHLMTKMVNKFPFLKELKRF